MRQRGVTIIELVVAVAIMGVMVSLLLPALGAARESARRVHCANRLRQLVTAVHSHHDFHNRMPAGVHSRSSAFPYLAWPAQLLPFIERNDLWLATECDYARRRHPFVLPAHRSLSEVVTHFSCPSDGMAEQVHFARNAHVVALTDYLGVAGTNFRARDGVFFRDSTTRMGDVHDGTSQTLCIGERPPSADAWYGWWYAGVGQQESGVPDMLLGVNEVNIGYDVFGPCPPLSGFQPGTRDSVCSTLHFWSYHPDGAHYAMCDGAVRMVAYGTDNGILRAISTRSEGDIASDDW